MLHGVRSAKLLRQGDNKRGRQRILTQPLEQMGFRRKLSFEFTERLFLGNEHQRRQSTIASQLLLDTGSRLARDSIIKIDHNLDVLLEPTSRGAKIDIEQQENPHASQRKGCGQDGHHGCGPVGPEIDPCLPQQVEDRPHAQTRCCSPVERPIGNWSRLWSTPTARNASVTLRRMSAPDAPCTSRGSATLSKTDFLGKSRKS